MSILREMKLGHTDVKLQWPGKDDDALLARRHHHPATTLDLSAGRDFLIVGDNLAGLSSTMHSLHGQVQSVYLDPPYNTGRMFTFRDRARSNTVRRSKRADWLSMMLPRLILLRETLTESGTICISIDAKEVHVLRSLMDEVFGASNFIAEIIWQKRAAPPNDVAIGDIHEYIVMYAKSIRQVSINLSPRSPHQVARYKNPDSDPRGPWMPGDLSANTKGGRGTSALDYPIANPSTGQEHAPPLGACWRFNSDTIEALLGDDRIYFGKSGTGRPKLKRFLSEVRDGTTISTIWQDAGTNADARSEITDSLGRPGAFETPKPLALMRKIVEMTTRSGDLILDPFAGSGTTGCAAIELGRRYVLFESADAPNGSEYGRIADITRARIEHTLGVHNHVRPLTVVDLAVVSEGSVGRKQTH